MFEDKIYIIAEAGVNHNGSLEMAKQLIDAGKKAGVDCVKFQTWVTEELITTDAPKAEYQTKNDGDGSQFQMLKSLELSYDDFKELQRYSKEQNIDFLSTPDEKRSLDFLVDELKINLLKVGSGEIGNLLYLKQIAQKKLPVILSTGMSNLADVETAYYTLLDNGTPEITILHCTSEYPAPLETVNLKAMDTIQSVFKCAVGYSDHTDGIAISIAAAALGARVIEKHFTLDKNLPGPDHKASLNPEELKEMVDGIRAVELALGDGIKRIQKVEKETKKVVGKGLYVNRELKAGDVISEDCLVGRRPMKFIPVDLYEQILGKKIKTNLNKWDALDWKHIDFT
ncbi:MAG: N-acetylneuraminate synthase [Bacteroidetes bacterium]|nr:N-acetylneuraminate synthase [Bacteroidota bacterium]